MGVMGDTSCLIDGYLNTKTPNILSQVAGDRNKLSQNFIDTIVSNGYDADGDCQNESMK